MSAIVWDPEFSVNIKVIDEQHKKLVDTINMLYDAMSEGKGSTVLADIFNNLAEYTTVHFATEEDFMIRFSYPDYAEHKSA
ncbi:MAG: bacteriohemerythrin, partial [Syntrophus sp. (in: bacteria)]